MEKEEKNEFSLTVTFRDMGRSPHSIPEEALDRLSVDVAALIVQYFNTAGKSAKAAFDRHRSCPYPGDDVQLVLEKAEVLMANCLTNDFGPTAAKSLHPCVHFTKIEPE